MSDAGFRAHPVPVTLVMRHPVRGWHSIETVFESVAAHLPSDVSASFHILPRPSTGLVGRLVNLLDAWRLRRRPGVFHITGDVHYLALVLPRRRTVLTIHDLGTLATRGMVRRLLIALLWFHLPVRRVASVTAISASTRDQLVALVPGSAGRIALIPNPLPPGLGPRSVTRGGERPRVLAIGATPNKNLERLVEAVAPLDVELMLIGAVPPTVIAPLDPTEPKVRATVRVAVDLPRSEVIGAYGDADVVALVSTYEGFGLPVIEAQGCGVPVVVSDLPVLREVAGDAAMFVDPHDATSIRRALVTVLSDADLRGRLVVAGLENVRRFAADRVAESYAACYREVERAAISGMDA